MENKQVDIVFDINRILEQSQAIASLLATTKDPYTARPTVIDPEQRSLYVPFLMEAVIACTERFAGYAEHIDFVQVDSTGLVTYVLNLPHTVKSAIITLFRTELEQAIAAQFLNLLYSGDMAAVEERAATSRLFSAHLNRATSLLASI